MDEEMNEVTEVTEITKKSKKPGIFVAALVILALVGVLIYMLLQEQCAICGQKKICSEYKKYGTTYKICSDCTGKFQDKYFEKQVYNKLYDACVRISQDSMIKIHLSLGDINVHTRVNEIHITYWELGELKDVEKDDYIYHAFQKELGDNFEKDFFIETSDIYEIKITKDGVEKTRQP